MGSDILIEKNAAAFGVLHMSFSGHLRGEKKETFALSLRRPGRAAVRYGSASWQVNAPLHDGCAGERGAGTGGWPARGDASIPTPHNPTPAFTGRFFRRGAKGA